ncbi:MAG: hypothetical protein A2Y33_03755 [Spirochaetes bacterium GWF1_51_8]|nr:MAG: hypothetical protein A2Y33_03755 [Spirochaetes bacterium GWF1_51_8]
MEIVFAILFAVFALSLSLGIFTLIKLRHPVEKMVSLDTLTTLITAVLLVVAVFTGSVFILDIAIIYAILSFGAVLVIARYREGGF